MSFIEDRKVEIEKQITNRHFKALTSRAWDIRRAVDELLFNIEQAETQGLKWFNSHQSSAFIDGYPARDAAQITNRLGQITALLEELDMLKWAEKDEEGTH